MKAHILKTYKSMNKECFIIIHDLQGNLLEPIAKLQVSEESYKIIKKLIQ